MIGGLRDLELCVELFVVDVFELSGCFVSEGLVDSL